MRCASREQSDDPHIEPLGPGQIAAQLADGSESAERRGQVGVVGAVGVFVDAYRKAQNPFGIGGSAQRFEEDAQGRRRIGHLDRVGAARAPGEAEGRPQLALRLVVPAPGPAQPCANQVAVHLLPYRRRSH